jgi:hypothetical protein
MVNIMMNKYRFFAVLATLSNGLSKLGYPQESESVAQLLSELLDDGSHPDYAAALANIVGLQGDVKPEDMGQGFALEPFFSDTSPVQ